MTLLYVTKKTMTREELVEILGFERNSELHRAIRDILPHEIKAGREIRFAESTGMSNGEAHYYTIKIGLNNDNIN
jgi:hypothetical protein